MNIEEIKKLVRILGIGNTLMLLGASVLSGLSLFLAMPLLFKAEFPFNIILLSMFVIMLGFLISLKEEL